MDQKLVEQLVTKKFNSIFNDTLKYFKFQLQEAGQELIQELNIPQAKETPNDPTES